jgi:type IV secretory pathway VirB10-like protein
MIEERYIFKNSNITRAPIFIIISLIIVSFSLIVYIVMSKRERRYEGEESKKKSNQASTMPQELEINLSRHDLVRAATHEDFSTKYLEDLEPRAIDKDKLQLEEKIRRSSTEIFVNKELSDSRLNTGNTLVKAEGKDPFKSEFQREEQTSPFTITTGTLIPAILKEDLNSDLQGEVRAQVSQNVYDSKTGEYLLIPSGATLFGVYLSEISYGEERVNVAWKRLIFPDSSAFNLETMKGSDAMGQAGFSDEVDNHYFKIFGSAVLMSVISAGVQLSQPQQGVLNQNSPSQIASGALGQQVGGVGLRVAEKNLNIKPTLHINKGYRFVVKVNKDLSFAEEYAWQESYQ